MRKSDTLFGQAFAMRLCRVARCRKYVYLHRTRSHPDMRDPRWESNVPRLKLDLFRW